MWKILSITKSKYLQDAKPYWQVSKRYKKKKGLSQKFELFDYCEKDYVFSKNKYVFKTRSWKRKL